MEPTTIAIDLAKRVFQIHFVEPGTGVIHSKALKRAQLTPFFANRAQCRIVMEACGSAHHWARQLAALGHDVRLVQRSSSVHSSNPTRTMLRMLQQSGRQLNDPVCGSSPSNRRISRPCLLYTGCASNS